MSGQQPGKLQQEIRLLQRSLPNPRQMACHAVNSGNGILLSILNKTIKAVPANMLPALWRCIKSRAEGYPWRVYKDNFVMVLLAAAFLRQRYSARNPEAAKARKAEACHKKKPPTTRRAECKIADRQRKTPRARTGANPPSCSICRMTSALHERHYRLAPDLAARHSTTSAGLKKYTRNIQVCVGTC